MVIMYLGIKLLLTMSKFFRTMPSKHELDNISMFDSVNGTLQEIECDFDYLRLMECLLIKHVSRSIRSVSVCVSVKNIPDFPATFFVKESIFSNSVIYYIYTVRFFFCIFIYMCNIFNLYM